VEGSVVQPLFSCRVTRAESSHFIRRITDGVIAENQGKARGTGELRVALFPSKHPRVRIPSPALTAKIKRNWPPIGGRLRLKVTYPLSKDSPAHASPIHVSASVEPTLVCATAATMVTPRRESHYSESALSSAMQRSICHMQPPAASIFVQGRRIMREGHFIRELPRRHLA